MRKRKHFKFSKRWNQAQFCILICLEAVLSQSCKVSNILTMARKKNWMQMFDGSMLDLDLPENFRHNDRTHPRSDSGTFFSVESEYGNKNSLKLVFMACAGV